MAKLSFIKNELINKLNQINKSIDDIAYYRISYNKQVLKGQIDNIFEGKQLMDALEEAKLTFLYLGIIVFKDNTWIEYVYVEGWIYYAPIPYKQLMEGFTNE